MIVSLAISAACLAAFAASYAFGHGLDAATLVCCGAKDRELILAGGQWWRLVSAGFLHADLLHLAANLYALVAVGTLVERLWGHRRFLILYVVALVGGNAASLAATQGVSVGASGAVFGLFGALVILATRYRALLPPRGRVALGLNLAIVLAANVALGILVPFIDNAAHLGGLAAGGLAALVLAPVRVTRRSWASGEMLASVAAAAAAIGVAGSLLLAARYAMASQTMLLLGGSLETYRLERGELRVSVPRGWEPSLGKGRGGHHKFVCPGLGVVMVQLTPGGKVEAVASMIQGQWTRHGAELVAARHLTVADQPGVELLVRCERAGDTQRHREVVFATRDRRLVQASFGCLETRYARLEVLFDRILHSIRVGPPPRVATADEQVWERVGEDPTDPDATTALAAHYIHKGRHEPAERLLLATLWSHPRHAEGHNQLAVLYATAPAPLRQPDRAVRHAERAADLVPDTPRYLATLAIAREAAGDRARALEAACRAAALAPDDATYADLVKRLSR